MQFLILVLGLVLAFIMINSTCSSDKLAFDTLDMHKKSHQACIDQGGVPIMDEKAPARLQNCLFPKDNCKKICEEMMAKTLEEKKE